MTFVVVMLLLGGVGIGCGVIGLVYANEATGAPDAGIVYGAEATLTVEVPDSLSLSLENENVSLDISGADFGRLRHDTFGVLYSSSSKWGYGLTMVSGGDGNLNLVSDGADAEASIPSITVPTQADAMKPSSWGYFAGSFADIESQQFLPIPTASTGGATLDSGEGARGSTRLPVTVGVIVDSSVPSGLYRDTLVGATAPLSGLTVDPNGGTWTFEGVPHTDATTIERGADTVIEVPDPTDIVRTVTYDTGDTGASSSRTVDYVTQAFRGWATGGDADTNFDHASRLYTFGTESGSLVAEYEPGSLTDLPTLTLDGHDCSWMQGDLVYDSGATDPSIHVTGDLTFTVSCEVTSYTYELRFDANGGDFVLPAGQRYPEGGTTTETEYVFTVGPVNAPAVTDGKSGLGDWSTRDEIPYRDGYVFTGWGTGAAGDTPLYPNGDEFTVQATSSSPVVTLYAQWVAVEDAYMQNFGSACDAMLTHAVGKLADARDGKRYRITKMKDGGCWMTQNLALGKAGVTLSLTQTDSAVASGGYTVAGTQIQTDTNAAWATGSTDAAGADVDRIYVTGDTEIGNYYNWHTATAGVGVYADYNKSIDYSICPKNWGLPYGGRYETRTYNYSKLLTKEDISDSAEGSAKIQGAPYWFRPAGYYYYEFGVHNQGVVGIWQSRTSVDSAGVQSSAYVLDVERVVSNPQSFAHKVSGRSVRCVFGS